MCTARWLLFIYDWHIFLGNYVLFMIPAVIASKAAKGLPTRLEPLGNSVTCTQQENVPSADTLRTAYIQMGYFIYVFGGTSMKRLHATRDSFRWSLSTGQWEALPPMKQARYDHSLTVISEEETLIVGNLL